MRFELLPDRLEEALVAQTPSQLDLPVDSAGGWSVRQIVHHVADSELLWLAPLKAALAEPGRIYSHNLMDEERWAESLDYRGRPVEPSLALFRAVRAHVAQLLRQMDDPWQRYLSFGEGGEWKPTVADLIDIMDRHVLEHIEQILSFRDL